MSKWTIYCLFVLVFAAYSCGGGGTTTTPDDDATTDQTGGDAVEPMGCQTPDDCIGKGAPEQCQKVDCQANQCVVVPVLNGTPCEDGDLCTDNDQCTIGQCQGTVKECSDGNLCTDDACNAATGQCDFINNTKGCDDGNACTQTDQCDGGVCTGADNQCDCQVDDDCEEYDDGNPCTGVVRCVNSECVVDQATVVDCSGIDAGPCKDVYCDEQDGQCKTKNSADDSGCDDGNACTAADSCSDGSCVGETLKCDDGDECTVDGCDPATGCTTDAVDDGTECNDGSLCTSGDHCEAGACVGDLVEECDSCEADEDCQDFEDGNLCNGTLKCIEGKCLVDDESIVVCDIPEGDCTESKCNPATGECETGEMLDGTPCDDANFCTELDYCSMGDCKGLPIDCDDVNACTDETCDPDVGCVYEPKEGSCGDGDPCTLNDHCADGVCVGDPDPACQCDSSADCEDFEDGDFCNGTLICENQKCVLDPDTIVDCNIPGLDTCVVSTCEPETGYCVLVESADGIECDDLNACTADDLCFEGICKGLPVYCDDGNVCTDDSCDPNVGCVHGYNNADCDDGSICTLNDYCDGGFCTGDPNPECVCQADADCDVFEDGNMCNGDLVCKGFKCVVDQDSIVFCDKSGDTDCLVTVCVPETGACTQAAFEDGKPCFDDNACTLIDMCVDGICTGSFAPDCDDFNECTNDSCDPQLGCVAVPNTSSCDDGDPCTGGDTCEDGLCQPGEQDLCGGDTCLPDWTLSCGGSDAWGTDKNGATNVVTGYACNSFDYPGPEYTYTFTAPYDAEVTVSLSEEEADTDLIVLENMGDGCDPDQCRDWHFNHVTFEAVEGTTYFFVVDGYDNGVQPLQGSYTIEVECKPLHELTCDDGVDDDEDGLTDCDDDDCLGTEACPLPICEPAWTLDCGDSDSWGNYFWGSTDVIEEYPCANWVYDGPEYTYVFVAPVSKSITVVLTEETAETDLLVLQASDELVCDPDLCVATGFSEVSFDAVAGTTYYLVVDGWAGAEGSYTITVDCPPDVEFDCTDDVDNDEDGAVDCDDDDCALADACAVDCNPGSGALTVECGFGEDWYNFGYDSTNKANDYACTGDNLDGPEVSYTFTAPYEALVTVSLSEETEETDILVVEQVDGQCLVANCIDHDMSEVAFDAAAGAIYYLIVDGFNAAEGNYHIDVQCTPATEQNCSDELDEDEDGLVDCLDPDCFPGGECQAACVPDDSTVAAELTCGSTDSWSTDGFGSNDLVDAYSCNTYPYPGPEYVYTLTVDDDTDVTVLLSEETADLDVMVLEDAGLGCNPASCIDFGLSSASFFAEAGVTYYVAVDGYQGETGSYDIEVVCN